MRIFGFLSIFLTKINTNSAKSCLLFRRKGIRGLHWSTHQRRLLVPVELLLLRPHVSLSGRNHSQIVPRQGRRGRRFLYDPIAVKILRQNLNCFWPFLVQKSKNPHYNNLFIFRFFSKIILMRIFVFLNIFCRQKIPFWRKLMVFYFFMFRIFFKNYTHAVFHFFVVFFTSKKSVFNAKNENSENAENAQNAENSHQNFDCYGVIQQ